MFSSFSDKMEDISTTTVTWKTTFAVIFKVRKMNLLVSKFTTLLPHKWLIPQWLSDCCLTPCEQLSTISKFLTVFCNCETSKTCTIWNSCNHTVVTIYMYKCNQCLLPKQLWVLISAPKTRNTLQLYVIACQLHVWFTLHTLYSIDNRFITKILLKVVLNTRTLCQFN
jgi:hypothetical protein